MTELSGIRRIVLCGLEPEVARELTSRLRTVTTPGCRTQVCGDPREEAANGAEVIFCPASKPLITHARRIHPSACLIAVSRLPETGLWLDAMEAGADDYCAPPLETGQLAWIIESAVLSRPVAV